MKNLIQRMTDIENATKKPLMEDCGMGMTPPVNQGTPVSINVSLNASGKEHVQDLIDMMKNAGLGGAQAVAPAMMPMRMDMEKFRDTVDAPKALPAPEGLGEEFSDELDDFVNGNRSNFEVDEYSDDWDAASEEFIARVKKAGHKVTEVNDEASPVIVAMSGEEPVAWYDFENTVGFIKPVGESYANEPDEAYGDTQYMTKDLSGGINREKKMFKPAAKGDNPMAVENIKEKLYALLAEKKAKPDFLDMDKDGDKKEPMKKAVADKKGGKPQKGVNPFAKKESVKEESDMKTGEKKKSSTGGTIEKTKTGIKHTAGKNYSGKAADAEKKVKEATKTPSTWTDSKGNKHPATKVKGDKYTGKDAEAAEKNQK
jgi:hypothetical protein